MKDNRDISSCNNREEIQEKGITKSEQETLGQVIGHQFHNNFPQTITEMTFIRNRTTSQDSRMIMMESHHDMMIGEMIVRDMIGEVVKRGMMDITKETSLIIGLTRIEMKAMISITNIKAIRAMREIRVPEIIQEWDIMINREGRIIIEMSMVNIKKEGLMIEEIINHETLS